MFMEDWKYQAEVMTEQLGGQVCHSDYYCQDNTSSFYAGRLC